MRLGNQVLCCDVVLSQDEVALDYLSTSQVRSISGNGMSLRCAGFCLLMAVLCVSDR